jgi:exonuclease III
LDSKKLRECDILKIAAWAIDNGDEHVIIEDTANHLRFNDVDLVVLTGWRTMDPVQSISKMMECRHIAYLDSNPQFDTVAIVSRSPLLTSVSDDTQEQFCLEVYLPEHSLTILGMRFPVINNVRMQIDFFQRLIRHIEVQSDARKVLIGNCITGGADLSTVLDLKRSFQDVVSSGWIDAWRYFHPITYEKTWFNKTQKGICLDFVLLSPILQKLLVNAYHSQVKPGFKSASRVLIVELE